MQIDKEHKKVTLTDSKHRKPNDGCFIKTSTAFVFIFLAVLSIVGVGVIVAFLGPRINDIAGKCRNYCFKLTHCL